MKKIVFTTLLMVATTILMAKEYEPTEGWPYMFEQFIPSIVYYDNGKAESADINVHLVSNTLHFVDGNNIKVVREPHHIDSVVCENNVLLYKGNLYVQRMAQTAHIVLGGTVEADINALTDEGNGAYGSPTSTGATTNIASFRDHGNISAQRYQEMIANRHNTRTLPTIKHIIFVIDNREICQANKRGVNSVLSKEQKNAFKAFLKENKIDWKKTDDLILVAEFLETILIFE